MKWPDSLVRDICARRTVLFFGAGVSMNSVGADGATRPKNWQSFLLLGAARVGETKKSLEREVRRLIARNDLLTACEVVKNALGREAFVELVKNEYQVPAYHYASIHEALWALDLRISISPNIDNIYESLVAERGHGTVSVKTYKDHDVAETVRRRDRAFIKSHGSVTAANDIVFTRSEYARARNDYREFFELLYSLLCTHSFLFVGCGLDDPDIRFLLEDYRYRYPFSQKHYFCMPKDAYGAEVREVLSESLNLDFVLYSSAHDHKELLEGLQKLAEQVELGRVSMGASTSW